MVFAWIKEVATKMHISVDVFCLSFTFSLPMNDKCFKAFSKLNAYTSTEREAERYQRDNVSTAHMSFDVSLIGSDH